MIKCKEDLKNTYIVNDRGELRDLYISALGRFGVDTCESDAHFLIYEPDDYPHMDTARLGWHNYNNSRRLTISDLKPRTRTEYEKVTESASHVIDEFENGGEFYYMAPSLTKPALANRDGVFNKLRDGDALYRKVEKEIDWRDDADSYFLKTKYLGIYCTIEDAITRSDYCDEFLELCRVALRANGEIE